MINAELLQLLYELKLFNLFFFLLKDNLAAGNIHSCAIQL